MTAATPPRRVAVITGASQGIGAGLVQGYRRRGYQVLATSRSITASDDPDVAAVRGDVADPGTARRVVDEAISRYGRIDTLVNNAGVFLSKPFLDYTTEDFAAVLATNLGGFFHMSQAVAPHMLEQRSGHIVNITTSVVDQPITGLPTVLANLTKGGIGSATKALAIEYAQTGIRVNAVSPGIIDTPMHAPGTLDFLATLHPLKRMGTVPDVVAAVLYLEDAGFITGETVHVDGGQNAGH
jgi:NAD(P)-dependent dehydrogenase (short-subunit alcohol dehydrogenase family)